jgi:hypothetical protein
MSEHTNDSETNSKPVTSARFVSRHMAKST